MANALAASARQAWLEGSISWLSDTIKVVLVSSSYTYSAAHDFLDDVAIGYRVATSSALTSKTSTNGAADAADVTFTAVAGGSTVTGLWVYKDTGVAGTSRLLFWYDTKSDTTPINITTNGGDIQISWSASGLATL